MTPAERDEQGPWLSIGALSRSTGVPVETLRTWENRYGFPVPRRKPSGHRVYALEAVPRLRRIAQAISQGHRAGQVVPASDEALTSLLQASAGTAPPGGETPPPLLPASHDLPALLHLVQTFDGDGLVRAFLTDWARLGPIEFLQTRVAPLLNAVGSAWERGEIEIRHEHFASERIGDLLRSLRLPLEERAAGPLVIYATLPGEAHAVGLQMAALILAAAGCRNLYLGSEVPPPQLASLARDTGARAVALSVSAGNGGPATLAALGELRGLLPRRIALLAGGEGARAAVAGVEVIDNLRELDAWGRRLVAGVPAARRASP